MHKKKPTNSSRKTLSEAVIYFYALFRLMADCAQKNEEKKMIFMVKSGLKKIDLQSGNAGLL